MVKTRPFSFIWARDAEELRGGQRALYWMWNAAALLASSAGICVLSLFLAIGVYRIEIFFDYFRHPLIFLLNWLPILLLQLLLWSLTGRQWLAFFLAALLFLGGSAADYYKLTFRYEPVSFSDLKLAGAALRVASHYDLRPNARILASLVYLALGTPLLALLARGRPGGKKCRLAVSLVLLLSVFPLWRFVYASDHLYEDVAVSNEHVLVAWRQQLTVSKGFVYPFLHSIKDDSDAPPEGYDADRAAALLAAWEDAPIPEDRKPDLLVLQLEAFSDLESMGLEGISPDTYRLYRALEEESYTGNLIVNVYGGTTIDTERCFLSGGYALTGYSPRSYSHVRYLRSQGYTAVGGHPNAGSMYSRAGVDADLGFEEYWFLEDHYGGIFETDGWFPDSALFPDILTQVRSYASREDPFFSFFVSIQGHGPYAADAALYDTVYWPGEGYSEESRCILNNYLGSVHDTQEQLAALIDQLREEPEPVVVLLYGDHKPWLGNDASVLRELGVNIDLSTEEGFLNYYSTRYLIWANAAAKEQLGEDFTGEGPDVSAGFLMNLLFEKLGWEGSAFIQFGDSIRQTLPVVTSNGYYYEDGRLTSSLSPEGQKAFRDLEDVVYYLNRDSGDPLQTS